MASVAQLEAEYNKIKAEEDSLFQELEAYKAQGLDTTLDVYQNKAQRRVDLGNQLLSLSNQIQRAKDEEAAAKTSASSNTAADTVANSDAKANPATQNTGSDSSASADSEVTDSEKQKINANNDGSVPAEVNADAKPVSKSGANADDVANSTIKKDEVGNTATAYKTRDNPLHDFPSYTYGLTIHALSTDDYKTLVNTPKNFKFTSTLISSASRYHDSRTEQFLDDFYFEDFKMQTVIGLNANTRGTNGIDLSFTIIEPYGMTLINRLLDVSTKVLKCQNYLQVPYVLEINFFAYDDSGNMINLKDHTKIIPFKFTGMKIRAGVKGTEYQCTAVPFNHQAHFYDTQSVRANMEITAQTVFDFFNPDVANSAATAASAEAAYKKLNPDKERQEKTTTNAPSRGRYNTGAQGPGTPRVKSTGTTPREPDNQQNTKATIKSRSLPDAYNSWYATLKAHGKTPIADEIAFIVDDDIAKCKVAIPGKVDVKNTPTASNDKAGTNANAKSNNPRVSKKTPVAQGNNMNVQSFVINAGSSINTVIDQILTNSTYITDQLTDPEVQKANPDAFKSAENLSAAKKVDSVNWYKIIPKIELLGFDPNRQMWAKKTTFYIKKFTYYNTKDPRAPIAKLPAPVKDYQFLYTGKNRDIINFDMDFNALFYTAIQVEKKQKEQQALYQGSNASESGADKSSAQPGNTPTPVQGTYIATDVKNSQGGTNSKSETQNSTSFRDSVYSQLNGDMLNLNLQILGDPEFIKQDDILYYPDSPGYKGDMQYVHGDTGSLTMDSGEIYCNVVFKTPSDINEQNGGLRYYGDETRSAFSGMYRVLTVASELRHGKFTQTLSLVRQQNQPDDGVNTAGKPSSISRTDSSVSDKNLNDPAQSSKVPGSQVNKTLSDSSQADLQPDVVPKPRIEEIAPQSPAPETNLLEETPDTPAPEPGAADLKDVAENGETRSIGDNEEFDGSPIVNRMTTTPEGGSAELSGRTVTDVDGFTTTFNAAGFPTLRVAPDGSSTTYDSLGNAQKRLVNGTYE